MHKRILLISIITIFLAVTLVYSLHINNIEIEETSPCADNWEIKLKNPDTNSNILATNSNDPAIYSNDELEDENNDSDYEFIELNISG